MRKRTRKKERKFQFSQFFLRLQFNKAIQRIQSLALKSTFIYDSIPVTEMILYLNNSTESDP